MPFELFCAAATGWIRLSVDCLGDDIAVVPTVTSTTRLKSSCSTLLQSARPCILVIVLGSTGGSCRLSKVCFLLGMGRWTVMTTGPLTGLRKVFKTSDMICNVPSFFWQRIEGSNDEAKIEDIKKGNVHRVRPSQDLPFISKMQSRGLIPQRAAGEFGCTLLTRMRRSRLHFIISMPHPTPEYSS